MRNALGDEPHLEATMAKVLRFSKHFVRRWAERSGGLPSIEEINRIIAGSLCILKQRTLYGIRPDGTKRRHRELSHFWNDEAGVILLIDELDGTAVTVITPDMRDKYASRDSQN
jgi:hypothetical protein